MKECGCMSNLESDGPKSLNQAAFGVLAETEEFLVVDKPAGLLVHPTKPGGPRTLWDGVKDLLSYELANGGSVSIVNRLDRETSGIVLIAKTPAAARRAGLAMQNHLIRKRYLAVVFGWPDWDRKEITEPILRKGEVMTTNVYLQRMVHPEGMPSHTRFEVKSRGSLHDQRRFSVIAVEPLTGRTHQIRVHLAHAGHPVVGDKIYASDGRHYLDFIANNWTEELAHELWMPRHALHCESMSLEGTEWHSPLPEDMRGFLYPESP